MNRIADFVILFMSFVLVPVFGIAQQTPQRDASALVFLSQAVSAAGSSTNLTAIQDFTASGTITLFWGTQPPQGQLTVKSRGPMQFRLDSSLPQGAWSWIANNGNGEVVLPNTQPVPIYAQNCVNSGMLTWPIVRANAALQDQTTTVIDMGLVQYGNGQARQIRTQRNLQFDPIGFLSKLTQTDLFFDPSTVTLIALQDVKHPDRDAVNTPRTHSVSYGNYQNVNGVMVPFSIMETVDGQKTWQIQVSSIAFNTGLTDADFQF
jgi:outer membrane lipoprotein-sorting protein